MGICWVAEQKNQWGWCTRFWETYSVNMCFPTFHFCSSSDALLCRSIEHVFYLYPQYGCCCGSIIAYKALIGQQFGVGFSRAVHLTQVLADFQLQAGPTLTRCVSWHVMDLLPWSINSLAFKNISSCKDNECIACIFSSSVNPWRSVSGLIPSYWQNLFLW
jgi:hypothetical protein